MALSIVLREWALSEYSGGQSADILADAASVLALRLVSKQTAEVDHKKWLSEVFDRYADARDDETFGRIIAFVRS